MIEIEKMDKKALYEVMLDLLYSINVGWFKLESNLKEIYRYLNKETELNQILNQVNADLGRYEAKRLTRTLKLGTDIDSLIRALLHSHWAAFENIEVHKLSDKSFRMRTLDCTTQKATQRKGLKYYDCALPSQELRQVFFSELNRAAKVKRVFTPSELGTFINGNVSCEWEITID